MTDRGPKNRKISFRRILEPVREFELLIFYGLPPYLFPWETVLNFLFLRLYAEDYWIMGNIGTKRNCFYSQPSFESKMGYYLTSNWNIFCNPTKKNSQETHLHYETSFSFRNINRVIMWFFIVAIFQNDIGYSRVFFHFL